MSADWKSTDYETKVLNEYFFYQSLRFFVLVLVVVVLVLPISYHFLFLPTSIAIKRRKNKNVTRKYNREASIASRRRSFSMPPSLIKIHRVEPRKSKISMFRSFLRSTYTSIGSMFSSTPQPLTEKNFQGQSGLMDDAWMQTAAVQNWLEELVGTSAIGLSDKSVLSEQENLHENHKAPKNQSLLQRLNGIMTNDLEDPFEMFLRRRRPPSAALLILLATAIMISSPILIIFGYLIPTLQDQLHSAVWYLCIGALAILLPAAFVLSEAPREPLLDSMPTLVCVYGLLTIFVLIVMPLRPGELLQSIFLAIVALFRPPLGSQIASKRKATKALISIMYIGLGIFPQFAELTQNWQIAAVIRSFGATGYLLIQAYTLKGLLKSSKKEGVAFEILILRLAGWLIMFSACPAGIRAFVFGESELIGARIGPIIFWSFYAGRLWRFLY